MKQYYFLLFLFVIIIPAFSQTTTNKDLKGYILSIENEEIYLDLTKDDVQIGDMFKIIKEGDVMIHPVTNKKIKKKDDIIVLKIINTEDEYSIAETYPRQSIDGLRIGMKVLPMLESDLKRKSNKISIAVESISIVGGVSESSLGDYMSDLLVQELYKDDKLTIIDRKSIGYQINNISGDNEINNGYLGDVDYLIFGTAYPPDVVEASTGVPLKDMIGVAEAISGKNLGSQLVSNVQLKELKAIVKISLRVVDAKTGEIVFICTESQQAVGKSSLELEGGALNGLMINSGITDFFNTVSGMASKQALYHLSNYVIDFFHGRIQQKSFSGNMENNGIKSNYKKPVANNSYLNSNEENNTETKTANMDFKANISAFDPILRINDSVIYFDNYYKELVRTKIIGIDSVKGKFKIANETNLVKRKMIFKIKNFSYYKINPTYEEINFGDKVVFYRNGFKEGTIANTNPNNVKNPKTINIMSSYINGGDKIDKFYSNVDRSRVILLQ